MNENENENKQQQEQESQIDLAKAYQELKKNSYSKEEFNKLAQENNELKKLIIDDRKPEQQQEQKLSLDELYNNWQKPNQTNLDYCKNMVAYREAVIASGGKDPALPTSASAKITEADAQRVNEIFDIIKNCIEDSDNNSQVFTALLNSKTVDDPSILKAIAKKRNLSK